MVSPPSPWRGWMTASPLPAFIERGRRPVTDSISLSLKKPFWKRWKADHLARGRWWVLESKEGGKEEEKAFWSQTCYRSRGWMPLAILITSTVSIKLKTNIDIQELRSAPKKWIPGFKTVKHRNVCVFYLYVFDLYKSACAWLGRMG